jgi:hypothetical protein
MINWRIIDKIPQCVNKLAMLISLFIVCLRPVKITLDISCILLDFSQF